MRTRTYFNTPADKRPNQLPYKVSQTIEELDLTKNTGLYRVVESFIDMHKIPVEERVFGMIVSVVNDPIKKLNKTYIFYDKSTKRNYSNNQNWQIFSNSINEVLGLNGQYFEEVMEITIVHNLNRWPVQYVLIDQEGNEIFGRVKFIDQNMFKVEFDKYPVTGYMFYYI
jgi:hypothetical protein